MRWLGNDWKMSNKRWWAKEQFKKKNKNLILLILKMVDMIDINGNNSAQSCPSFVYYEIYLELLVNVHMNIFIANNKTKRKSISCWFSFDTNYSWFVRYIRCISDARVHLDIAQIDKEKEREKEIGVIGLG